MNYFSPDDRELTRWAHLKLALRLPTRTDLLRLLCRFQSSLTVTPTLWDRLVNRLLRLRRPAKGQIRAYTIPLARKRQVLPPSSAYPCGGPFEMRPADNHASLQSATETMARFRPWLPPRIG
jgi:hypothetical protein